jgi:hypothetical protein
MFKIFLPAVAAALLLVVIPSNPADAQIWIEVPVDGLNGYYGGNTYYGDSTHTDGTFTTDINFNDIKRCRLRLTGNLVWPSYYSCSGPPATAALSVNGYNFVANMSTISGAWTTNPVYVNQRVGFVTYLDWIPVDGATWEFLAGGTGSLVLSGIPRALPEGCSYDHGSSDTTAEVTDAILMFEMFEPNPVESSTWGRIKSLFSTD